MATRTADQKTMERGGFPAIGPKIGYIENEVTLVDGGSANDRTVAFVFDAATLVLSCGIEQKTPATNAVTASIGTSDDAAGSATTLAGELSIDDTAGDLTPSAVTAGVIVAAGSSMDVEISGDTGNDAVLRVFAIVADIGDVSGL